MCYIPWASYSFQFVACDFLGTLEKGNATAFAHDFYQYIVSSNMFSIHGLKIPIISKRSRLSQHFLPITHNYPQLPTTSEIALWLWPVIQPEVFHPVMIRQPCPAPSYPRPGAFRGASPSAARPNPACIQWGKNIVHI